MEVHFYVKKKIQHKVLARVQSISVILDMREHGMSYNDTVRKYWGVKTCAECSNRRSQVKD